jgi:cytochrome P450
MMLYPEVQTKLQAQIDTVVGPDRLPTFEDRDSLPYVEAVMKELFRWMPVMPAGVPHRASEDYVYKGYVIPKGALVLPNIWAMMHDPNVYHNPSTFNPDRFLGDKPERDPTSVCFGFGRRICPGRKLADATVWISIVKFAFALQITKPIDKDGKLVEPEVVQSSGIISHVVPFVCDVKPRNERVAKMVEETLDHQIVN